MAKKKPKTSTKSKPRKVGRPSKYSAAIVDSICERLANGESLRGICEAADMPDRVTVLRWLEANESFRNQYARAREEQADYYASEIIEIADDGSRDYKEDSDGREVPDFDHIQRSKLRVDARKWYASKLAPKKYGDKVQQEVSGPDGSAVPLNISVQFVRPNAG